MTNSCLCKSKRCNLSNSISSAKNTTVSSHEDTTQAPFGVISLASPQGRLLVTATRMLIKHGCPSLIRVKGRESENHPRIKLRKCKKAGRQAWLHIVCRHADLCSFFFIFSLLASVAVSVSLSFPRPALNEHMQILQNQILKNILIHRAPRPDQSPNGVPFFDWWRNQTNWVKSLHRQIEFCWAASQRQLGGGRIQETAWAPQRR